MARQRLKYCLSVTLIIPLAVNLYSQTNLVTIVGDAPQTNEDVHDFINSNPQVEQNEPQIQQQITAQNIEPTLENGFHMRFELQQAVQDNNFPEAPSVSSGFTSGSGSSGGGAASTGRARRHTPTLEERSFNTKKKMKRWLPKRKKRYHPHLCGRF